MPNLIVLVLKFLILLKIRLLRRFYCLNPILPKAQNCSKKNNLSNSLVSIKRLIFTSQPMAATPLFRVNDTQNRLKLMTIRRSNLKPATQSKYQLNIQKWQKQPLKK